MDGGLLCWLIFIGALRKTLDSDFRRNDGSGEGDI